MGKVRKISGYGGKYGVTEDGVVIRDGHALSAQGGRYVNLSWRGKVERVDVAYLVARAWVPNPQGRAYVVHRDGDLRNNRASNLKWSETQSVVRRWRKDGRRVLQFDLSGSLVGAFGSAIEAEEKTGVARSLICRCLRGEARRAKQWIWRYE